MLLDLEPDEYKLLAPERLAIEMRESPFLDTDLEFQFSDLRCQRCHDNTPFPFHPMNSVPIGYQVLEFGTAHIHYMPTMEEVLGVAVDAGGLEGREDSDVADELAGDALAGDALAGSVESEHVHAGSDLFAEFELAESAELELVDAEELEVREDISEFAESADSAESFLSALKPAPAAE
jgi:hypothetical protein